MIDADVLQMLRDHARSESAQAPGALLAAPTSTWRALLDEVARLRETADQLRLDLSEANQARGRAEEARDAAFVAVELAEAEIARLTAPPATSPPPPDPIST